MSHPAVPSCLTIPDSAKPSQKGGTLIAEDVSTLDDHRRRLADPDGYRPERCGHCGQAHPHAHDFRERVLRADPETPVELIRRYLCTACGAVWRVLPAVIARHLHRRWAVVQSAAVAVGELASGGSERRVAVPGRTVRRWASRLRASAAQLTQLLATTGLAAAEVIGRTGSAGTRAELVDAFAVAGLVAAARQLEQVAGWIHRLVPGIRLA